MPPWEWHEEHGRHEIFAGGKSVQLGAVEHSPVLKDELVRNEEQPDLDALGIAKNAREERARQRDENARMAKLYRKRVLKEPDGPELVRIQVPASAQPLKPAGEREEVGSFGGQPGVARRRKREGGRVIARRRHSES